MPELKEIALYVLLALVVVVAIIYLLSGTFKSSYSVQIELSQLNQSVTYPYQTLHYMVNISNKGNNQIDDLLVGFYLNGVQQTTESVSIPPRQSVAIVRNFTFSSPGPYEFNVIADPGHILDIANRGLAQNTITTNVTQPSIPNIYTSLPNTNISSTQSFTFDEAGMISTAAIGQRYNITLFNQLFGPSQGENVTLKIFENIAPYLSYANGAYISYANKSTAYVVWMQGTLNPQLIKYVTSSFGITTTVQPNGLNFAKLGNTTSLCTWYGGGWTKLIIYSNASRPATCSVFTQSSFNSTESANFGTAIKDNQNLTYLESKFVYSNVTPLGSTISMQGSNGLNLTAANIFNNSLGFFFVSSIKKNSGGANSVLANSTCYGLVYSNKNTSICSYYIFPRNGSASTVYGLINTSMINQNYILSIYSLVNQSSLVIAHESAARLINALNLSGKSTQWNSGFTSSCKLSNSSFPCKFVTFNYTGNIGTVNITNKLSLPIRVNNVNCELAPGFPNVTIGRTIAANQTAQISFHCYNTGILAAGAETQYTLLMNYTFNNKTITNAGYLNVTNPGVATK
jgi:hypothetical protein